MESSSFVILNGVPTKVSTWGLKLNDKELLNGSPEIVLIIPGNPGLNTFYNTFARNIQEQLKLPVWCVGHAGHNPSKDKSQRFPNVQKNKHLYNLDGQVKAKREFIQKYIPKNAKIRLIGHSMGAYVITELMEDPEIAKMVTHLDLLFPTLEEIGQTVNGKFYNSLVRPMVGFILFWSWVFYVLPLPVKVLLLNIYQLFNPIVISNFEPVIELVNPKILDAVFLLASDEMGLINERNDQVIEKYLDRMDFLYCETDNWAPGSYCEKLKKQFPNAKANYTEAPHAFVMHHSKEVADIIVKNYKK